MKIYFAFFFRGIRRTSIIINLYLQLKIEIIYYVNNKHTPVKIKFLIYNNLLKPICILKKTL